MSEARIEAVDYHTAAAPGGTSAYERDAVFEQLPESLRYRARELRKLVHQQHAVVPECAGMSPD